MNEEELPTSFDALAHEHNLSDRMRDLCRVFFKAGQAIGKRQAERVNQPKEERRRGYHPALDKDTSPGEFSHD